MLEVENNDLFHDYPHRYCYEAAEKLGYYHIYTVALQNCLRQAAYATSFYEGMLNTLKLGGSTYMNCALAGAVLGARFGYDSIPEPWLYTLKNVSPERASRFSKQKHANLKYVSVRDVDRLVDELLKRW